MRTSSVRDDHIRVLSDPAKIDRSDWEIAFDLKESGYLTGTFHRSSDSADRPIDDVHGLAITERGRAYLETLKAELAASAPSAVLARLLLKGLGAAALAAIGYWVVKALS